ncbi:hypothetical protein [Fundidesulfovibrio magnetotacticus]|nr:hypothetical protein [Fundidesulfovibrio magnetotacticus]
MPSVPSCPPDLRSAHRVEVARDFVIELAVWFGRCLGLRRIHLRDLGSPVFTLGRPPYPCIDNISAGGLGLSFAASAPSQLAALRERLPLALVYFKLHDPAETNSWPLAFMAGYEVKRVRYHEGRICLGLSLALDGAPHPEEMALDFVDARKYGNACLTKWCDDMQRRNVRGGCAKGFQGLRLDMLLSQLDAALAELPGRSVCPGA